MFDFTMADGFIFDCDGTLLDTLDAWDEAERDLFAQAGELTQAQEDEIHAAPIEQAAAILHERYGVGESAEDVLAHLDGHLLLAEDPWEGIGGTDGVLRLSGEPGFGVRPRRAL